jgi:RNA polymerase sigma factor (TIGR02999 family)
MSDTDDPIQVKHSNPTSRFFSMFYNELRGVARGMLARERSGHTLQPTALVNEAYLRLSQQKLEVFQNKNHFMAVGAIMMRRVLVDRARQSLAIKRNAGSVSGLEWGESADQISSEELIDLDQALVKLASLDPRQAQMIEWRFFAGFTIQELADAFQLSDRAVEYNLQMARAWLSRELQRL